MIVDIGARNWARNRLNEIYPDQPDGFLDHVVELIEHSNNRQEVRDHMYDSLKPYLNDRCTEFIDDFLKVADNGSQQHQSLSKQSSKVHKPISSSHYSREQSRDIDSDDQNNDEREFYPRGRDRYLRERVTNDDRQYTEQPSLKFRRLDDLDNEPKVPVYGPNSRSNGSNNAMGSKQTSFKNHDYYGHRCFVLKSVPKELNNSQCLMRHFQQFGEIQSLRPNYGGDVFTAHIEFVRPQSAMAAFRSPSAICNNRFIKMFWDASEIVDDNVVRLLPQMISQQTPPPSATQDIENRNYAVSFGVQHPLPHHHQQQQHPQQHQHPPHHLTSNANQRKRRHEDISNYNPSRYSIQRNQPSSSQSEYQPQPHLSYSNEHRSSLEDNRSSSKPYQAEKDQQQQQPQSAEENSILLQLKKIRQEETDNLFNQSLLKSRLESAQTQFMKDGITRIIQSFVKQGDDLNAKIVVLEKAFNNLSPQKPTTIVSDAAPSDATATASNDNPAAASSSSASSQAASSVNHSLEKDDDDLVFTGPYLELLG